MPHRNLNVLDAAEQAAKEINALIDRSMRPPLLHVRQLRDAAQSVVPILPRDSGAELGATETDRSRSPAARRRRRSAI